MFKFPARISLVTLIVTMFVTVSLWCFLSFMNFQSESELIGILSNVFITGSLILQLIAPFVGLVYSFFIKGNRKYIYMVLHFLCLFTISVWAFFGIMFRYFVPFAP